MTVEGQYHRMPTRSLRLAPRRPDDFLMPKVNTIEKASRQMQRAIQTSQFTNGCKRLHVVAEPRTVSYAPRSLLTSRSDSTFARISSDGTSLSCANVSAPSTENRPLLVRRSAAM